ncbi:hypothetical protein [Sphingobacterium sp. UBA5670]|uniref:hypothetical protein n=1 Tax=Sphingobacterium sp. UBA5670 TaxID=1947502 RepID=UPI0025EA6616|nr:hypothetical protein [Sphingobacterium sp. UBA5670]
MYILSENSPEIWSAFRKLAFRFSFVFIFSFILVFNNGTYPLYGYISMPLTRLMQRFVPWFSENILCYSYDHSVFINGSGDTSYAWVSLLILFLIALISAVIWSILDRKRTNYTFLLYWLTTAIRYYVAFMLINYGMIKIFHMQMQPPRLTQLLQPLGEYSPMGLAWTYIGYSKGYNLLIGLVEILSGLLLFRKTMVVGALITVATSINIMAVNYFYDVPVKMVSTALLLFSIFLLLPYLNSLFTFFITGRPAQLPPPQQPLSNRNWKRKNLFIAKLILLIIFSIQEIMSLFNTQKLIAEYQKKSPLYGIYRIVQTQKQHKSIPQNWRLIVFEFDSYKVLIRNTDYRPQTESVVIDAAGKKITLNNYEFDYRITPDGNIRLTKTFGDHMEEIKLVKQDPQAFELMRRKFNWIQEYPYSR